MKTHEQLLENYEDAWFALLMEKVAEQEGERFEQLNQQLLNDPSAAVPPKIDQRCMRTITLYFSQKRREAALQRTIHVLHLAAIIVAIVATLFTVAFAISEDFRVATRNLIISVNERYTEFRFGEKAELKLPTGDKKAFDFLDIGWVPEDFWISEVQYNQRVYYENEDGEQILVASGGEFSTLRLDTENATITNTEILGLPAHIIEKDGQTSILLVDKIAVRYYLTITSEGINFETTKKIAENLIWR